MTSTVPAREEPASTPAPGFVEVELPSGVRLRISGEVEAMALRRILSALRHAAWWLAPLAAMSGAHVKTAPVIHTDDTPVPLLSPGLGRTRTGRLWVYLADERSWQGPRARAA